VLRPSVCAKNDFAFVWKGIFKQIHYFASKGTEKVKSSFVCLKGFFELNV